MIKIDGLRLQVGFDDNEILTKIAKTLKIKSNLIRNFEIIRLSIDARKKPNVFYVANVGVELNCGLENKFKHLNYVLDREVVKYKPKETSLSPIVVGFGPAGMFAALTLARMGLKPIVLEQGKPVDEREEDVQKFWTERKLDKFSHLYRIFF